MAKDRDKSHPGEKDNVSTRPPNKGTSGNKGDRSGPPDSGNKDKK